MNDSSRCTNRRTARSIPSALLFGLVLQLALTALAHAESAPQPRTVQVKLTEWAVTLNPKAVPAGPVVFKVTNAGSIPHAFEVEGHGLEQQVPLMQPGAVAALSVDLSAGSYEAYCPVGKNSHKMLGMKNELTVSPAASAAPETPARADEHDEHMEMAHHEGADSDGDDDDKEYAPQPKIMKVTGGGTVIQILPGPFPFADSAASIIATRPEDQKADLMKKEHMGPYSNNVATVSGTFKLTAIDRGATGDSVSGVAAFTAQDGAKWKVVMDRVQTKDISFNPRFGGVIMGLFYHGSSNVHTPLVPTIQSSLALWAYAHLYRNDQLVTDGAMVHVMLLSRTRRASDWALDCWDCSNQPIEELQLQVTPPPNTPPFDSPGGFLFVNWEKSSGKAEPLAVK